MGRTMANWGDRKKLPLSNVRIGPVAGGGIQLSGFDAYGREHRYVKPPLRGHIKPVRRYEASTDHEDHHDMAALRRLYRGEG